MGGASETPVAQSVTPSFEHGATAPDRTPTVIEPDRKWFSLDLRSVWAYRELFAFLVWRDVKVRYKQTVVGALWAILQPLITILLFTVIFGNAAGLSSDGAPYAVFASAALLPWQLFAGSLQKAGGSIVGNQQLVTKVYFPRVIIPLASTLPGVVDLAVSSVVVAGLMAYYEVVPTLWVFILPLLVLLAVMTALAAGLWLAALNVRYRDIQYMLPLLVQVWFFATPIVYSTSILPSRFTFVYGLNPMVGVVQGFRWALLGHAAHVGPEMVLAVVMMLVLLVGGLVYFKRTESFFADLV